MITIDWKERLTQDTEDYLEHKLPKQDYDFEIIFNWYPERVNGKIPGEVIVLVTKVMAQHINRNHEQYIPFYQYLWERKGENGKLAFIQFMSRFLPKKPEVYLPLIEKVMGKANDADVALIFEKVFVPLLKKEPEVYLPRFYQWLQGSNEVLAKQSAAFLARQIKKQPEIMPAILKYLQSRWVYAMPEAVPVHVALLKAMWKQDAAAMLQLYQDYQNTRDPQTVEILCGAIADYHPALEEMVERWTHSGNARLKKAATTAYKVLQKKKA